MGIVGGEIEVGYDKNIFHTFVKFSKNKLYIIILHTYVYRYN